LNPPTEFLARPKPLRSKTAFEKVKFGMSAINSAASSVAFWRWRRLIHPARRPNSWSLPERLEDLFSD
jgi:hypothetical protein